VRSFQQDTELKGGAGRYVAVLHESWRGWSPLGGYLAGIALRAAGRESVFDTPLSITCHFLSVGGFGPCDVEVVSLRRASVAELLEVRLRQGAKTLLLAHVWTGQNSEGFEHTDLPSPAIPMVSEVPPMEELYPNWAKTLGEWPYLGNIEQRVVGYERDGLRREARAPRNVQWFRFNLDVDYADPYLNAARYALALDIIGWDAVKLPHPGDGRFYAPTLSLHADIHALSEEPWFVAEAWVPVAGSGRFALTNRVWSADGRPLASAAGTSLCRPRPSSLP